jgi:NADH-quinone oxidoreductase subunit E
MLTLTIQSILLLVAAFLISAAVGWALAGKRKTKVRVSAFDHDATPAIEDVTPEVAMAAEQFTSGVVVPFKMPVAPEPAKPEPQRESKSAYEPAPRFDMAASRADPLPRRSEPSLMFNNMQASNMQGRVSSLAAMTPESVEAAVQQAGSGLEPVRLNAPRGPVDDLTVISGIGPSNQQELNELGIYHFWQIAGWTPEHVAWVSNRIRFPKRVVRENWMAQAAKLARLH